MPNLNKSTGPIVKSFHYCSRSRYPVSFSVSSGLGYYYAESPGESFRIIAYVFPGNRIRSLSNDDGQTFWPRSNGLLPDRDDVESKIRKRSGAPRGLFGGSDWSATKFACDLTGRKKSNEMTRQNYTMEAGRSVWAAAGDRASNAVWEIGTTQLCRK